MNMMTKIWETAKIKLFRTEMMTTVCGDSHVGLLYFEPMLSISDFIIKAQSVFSVVF